MNRQEATNLLTYLNRAGLVGAMEGAAAVWADALPDVSYTNAQEAVREMVRTRTSDQRWVTPGDVAARVRAIRAARFDAAERDPAHVRMCPPPDLDPRGEIAWRKAYRRGIGDGLTPTEADAAACQHLGITRPAPGPAIDHDQVRRLIEDSPVKRPEDEEPSS